MSTYTINKLKYDQFGRPTGILLLDKEKGISAHDLVDKVRRHLHFKKVGHAGALDSFATGLMLILVGKATKESDNLMAKNKKYRAEVLLGAASTTQDPEGEIIDVQPDRVVDEEKLKNVFAQFVGEYEQYVSIFSSVKVGGRKLRVVMRDSNYHKSIVYENEKKFIFLKKAGNETVVEKIEVPKRLVKIDAIKLVSLKKVDAQVLAEKLPPGSYNLAEIEVECSKGTYIRQLAEDIGDELKLPAMLVNLRRTEIGNLKLEQALELGQI